MTSRNQGSLGFPGGGSRDAPFSDRCLHNGILPCCALDRFLGRLHLTYSTCTPPGAIETEPGDFSCFRQGGTEKCRNPISRLTPPGSCADHEVLALVRPVVPYTLALSSKRSRPVMSLAPWSIGGHANS